MPITSEQKFFGYKKRALSHIHIKKITTLDQCYFRLSSNYLNDLDISVSLIRFKITFRARKTFRHEPGWDGCATCRNYNHSEKKVKPMHGEREIVST